MRGDGAAERVLSGAVLVVAGPVLSDSLRLLESVLPGVGVRTRRPAVPEISAAVSRQCPARSPDMKKAAPISRKRLIYKGFLVALQGFEPRTCGL